MGLYIRIDLGEIGGAGGTGIVRWETSDLASVDA